MGVPAFFRWVAAKYPLILLDVMEGDDRGADGAPNVEAALVCEPDHGDKYHGARWTQIDNLYIDCNGVVHPCCHPENGGPVPKSEEEMLENVGRFLDRLVAAVRPTALLYLAFDGVAPRAKMNQQRTRRFCSAREAEEHAAALKSLKNDRSLNGKGAPESQPRWDHNAITPGTEFMAKLALYVREWAEALVVKAPWLSVVISDASTPGEGEHKIMDYIRRPFKRRQVTSTPGVNPEQRHAVCGQDADLLFLSLALHLPRVYVLREQVPTGKKKKSAKSPSVLGPAALQLVSAQRLRQYLVADSDLNPLMTRPGVGFARDDERFLDDFILLCFFVGNDFLPQLPSLSIPDGGLDLLLVLYAAALPAGLGGYLTDPNGELNVPRIASLLGFVADLEPEILRRRANRDSRDQAAVQNGQSPQVQRAVDAAARAAEANDPVDAVDMADMALDEAQYEGDVVDFKALADLAIAANAAKVLRATENIDLGKPGFRDRYYAKVLRNGGHAARGSATEKKKAGEDVAQHMVAEYYRGLRFVAAYYHRGCASWSWFYPFHYAPLAADLAAAAKHPGTLAASLAPLQLGAPVAPMLQLMSVLPPASSHCCPAAARKLMTSSESSPLADCYPRDFEVDPNGKPAGLKWLWVALLPFVEIERIQKAFTDFVEPSLSEAEKKRNTLKPPELVAASDLSKAVHADSAVWTPLPAGRLPGRVAKLAAEDDACSFAVSRVAYDAPPLGKSKAHPQGPDAADDFVAWADLAESRSRKQNRLPAADDAIRRTLSNIHAASRGGRSSAPPREILSRPPRKIAAPCKFFQQGRCGKGAGCNFEHSQPVALAY